MQDLKVTLERIQATAAIEKYKNFAVMCDIRELAERALELADEQLELQACEQHHEERGGLAALAAEASAELTRRGVAHVIVLPLGLLRPAEPAARETVAALDTVFDEDKS